MNSKHKTNNTKNNNSDNNNNNNNNKKGGGPFHSIDVKIAQYIGG